MNTLKLWVVGETTPNSEEWSIWSEWALVVARDEKEAIQMSGRPGPCCEIPMTAPLHIVTMPEPNHGEDI